MKTNPNETGSQLVSKKKSWHFCVEKDFILDETIPPLARLLYLALESFISPTSAVAFPGMKFLAFKLNCTEDTVLKYRRELEKRGLLTVKCRRSEHDNKFHNNLYTLLDWPGAVPKKTGTALNGDGLKPGRSKQGYKSTQYTEDVQVHKNGHFVPINPENNTGAAAPAPAAASALGFDPSGQAGGRPPGPPMSSVRVNNQKVSQFLALWKEWATRAGIGFVSVPRDRAKLLVFFMDNENVTALMLMGFALAAWALPGTQSDTQEEDGFCPHWHCNIKGRKIATFLEFLPQIQEEIGWTGKNEQDIVRRIYLLAEKQFPVVRACS